MAQLQEVLNHNTANEALKFYGEVYKKRYKTDPVISNVGIAITTLKDVCRSVGRDKLMSMLEHFLSIDGTGAKSEWFKIKGHSLQIFKENLESINASLGSKGHKPPPPGPGLKIVLQSQCPKCEKFFLLQGTPEELQNSVHTVTCKSCLVPF